MTDNTNTNAADTTGTGTGNENSELAKHWRDFLKVHPAAELFPRMSETELRELADDIEKHGLSEPITLYQPDSTEDPQLLDGQNRLDALELLNRIRFHDPNEWSDGSIDLLGDDFLTIGDYSPVDPYAYVLSKNVHRRHLTAEQRRELIAKVLKAKPEASNRQVAKQVKADDKTVAKVRTELEATAEIPQLERTTGADRKARPSRKPVPSPPIERKPTSRPSPSKLPTLDEVVESGPVDALCTTLAEIAKSDPAGARDCAGKIHARFHAAINDVAGEIRNDDQMPAHARTMLDDGLPPEFIRAPRGRH
jgi:ParB-like nuclease domain